MSLRADFSERSEANSSFLIENALLALDYAEDGSFARARELVDQLSLQFPAEHDARVLQDLLTDWIDRKTRRDASSQHPSKTTVRKASSQAAPNATRDRIKRLKRDGLRNYSEERLEQAVECWQQVLELDPDDNESKMFIKRATAVLDRKRRSL